MPQSLALAILDFAALIYVADFLCKENSLLAGFVAAIAAYGVLIWGIAAAIFPSLRVGM